MVPPAATLDLEIWEERAGWLQAWTGRNGALVERIDTHISRVLLAGDDVYKLKKPVCFAYLDFADAARRRWAARREISLNRRTAPELYLGLCEITRAADGTLALDGPGEAVEPVVHLRRFDQSRLFDRLAAGGGLRGPLLERLADRIWDFHCAADPRVCDLTARMTRVVGDILSELRAESGPIYPPEEVEPAITALAAALTAAGPDLQQRAAVGAVRICHGDLHLGNVFCDPAGEPVAFDCIEFSEHLAEIDRLYDIAFLVMDLDRRASRDLARRTRDRYLAHGDIGDRAALNLLPFYLALRAGVRAHVSAAAGRAEDGPGYLALMRDYLAPTAPRLIAIGGLSGSGKSSLAARLAPTLGRAPGALVLRSDVIRKQLWGVTPETRLPADAYQPEVTAAVYTRLAELARLGLEAGWSVIADAVYARPAERAAIAAAAGAWPFTGLWLDLPESERVARVACRTDDASDADPLIAAAQSVYDLGAIDWWRLSGNTDQLARDLIGQI